MLRRPQECRLGVVADRERAAVPGRGRSAPLSLGRRINARGEPRGAAIGQDDLRRAALDLHRAECPGIARPGRRAREAATCAIRAGIDPWRNHSDI